MKGKVLQNNLNLLIKQLEYLNVSETDIKKLKYYCSLIQFVLKNTRNIIGNSRNKAKNILKEIEKIIGIELDYYKIEEFIRNLKGLKKDERKNELREHIKAKLYDSLLFEVKNKEYLERTLKKLEEKINNEIDENKILFYLKKKEEIKNKLEKLNDEYISKEMDKRIKLIEHLLDKLVGIIMKIDYIENTETILQDKYEYIITKIMKFCRELHFE